MKNTLIQEPAIQVYRNDFFSGILMLTKKLFMI
jgi:hypothetical protein